MDDRVSVISDPRVMMGKPVIAGTRITVELILEKLAAGETTDIPTLHQALFLPLYLLLKTPSELIRSIRLRRQYLE